MSPVRARWWAQSFWRQWCQVWAKVTAGKLTLADANQLRSFYVQMIVDNLAKAGLEQSAGPQVLEISEAAWQAFLNGQAPPEPVAAAPIPETPANPPESPPTP